MEFTVWLAEHLVDITLWTMVGAISIGALLVLVLSISSTNREQAWDDAYQTWCDNNPTPVPVNTWRDDFGAWKNNHITLDEFLERRWMFRQSK